MVFGRKKKKKESTIVAITDDKEEQLNEISQPNTLTESNETSADLTKSPTTQLQQNNSDSNRANENENDTKLEKNISNNNTTTENDNDERIESNDDDDNEEKNHEENNNKTNQRKEKRRRKHGDVILKRQETIDVILKYQLGQKELKMFQKDFRICDQDNTNTVNYDEFFMFINEKRTKYTDGIFKILNLDMQGSVNK